MTTVAERRTVVVLPATERGENLRSFPVGFAAYLPSHSLTNAQIEAYAQEHRVTTRSGDPLTAAKIARVTGIERRHVAQENETAEYMATQVALELAQKHDAPDAIIVSTTHPWRKNAAETVWGNLFQKKLVDKIPEPSPFTALDVHGACSGTAHALAFLKRHEGKFFGKRVFLIAAEKFSDTLPPLEDDPSFQRAIFSDATAGISGIYGQDLTVVGDPVFTYQPDNRHLLIPFEFDPSGHALVTSIPRSSDGYQHLNGDKVHKWAITAVPAMIAQALNQQPSFVRVVIPHQANGRITEAIAKNFPDIPIANTIAQIGNTASASSIFALREQAADGTLQSGDHALIAGFGAGLFGAAVTVRFGLSAEKYHPPIKIFDSALRN